MAPLQSDLDWTLPDPTRFISSKHCEVRYRDGAYWLYDVSTNGTFLNGSDGRLKAPHRLRNGDRLTIGQYIVAVALDGEDANAREPANAVPASATSAKVVSANLSTRPRRGGGGGGAERTAAPNAASSSASSSQSKRV